MSNDQRDIPIPSVRLSTPALVQSVLSQLQTEFAEWSWNYSRQVLQTLSPSRERLRVSFDALESKNSAPSDTIRATELRENNWHETRTGTVTAVQIMYSPDRQVLSETSISLEVIDMVPVLDAHPPYESCSPSPRNVFKGDDDDNMVFIPYSDDPSFNQVEHSLWYESFSWREDFDPDLQVILLEASYRLHTRHALEYKDIEKCDVLPLKLASCPGKPGLIAISRRRDPLIWSGNSIPAGCVFPSMNLPSNLRQRLQCRACRIECHAPFQHIV